MGTVCIGTGSVRAVVAHAQADFSTADEMLIGRIADGDQLAMRTLFARHHTRVYRFVQRLLRNEAAAEDVVSDVFLDVWRQAGAFEGRSTVSTWLLSMARFKALSAMRRKQHAEWDPEAMSNIADPGDDPETILSHKSDAQALRRGLSQLSSAHAEVMDLVYYHGKSVAEAADILGIPEATVKTRMFHARKKLAAILQEGASTLVH
jgi:RNA polymerase sigma-70 factor (ECF subfamily)